MSVVNKNATKKDAERDSGKARTRSTRDEETSSSMEQLSEKVEKQTKIDTMLISPTAEKEERNPGMESLVASLNSLNKKFATLASKEFIDKSLKKVVSEEFVSEKLASLKDELVKSIKSEMDKVYEQLKLLKTKVLSAETETEELKNSNSDMIVKLEEIEKERDESQKKNEELEAQLSEREARLKDHEVRLNDIEQYTRRNSVRIYGDTDKNETIEHSRDLVIKLLKDKLLITVQSHEIDVAHRLGRFMKEGCRPIICKFVSRTLKRDVIKKRRSLKGSQIIIREDLTPKNAKILERASGKDEVVSACSDEGKITGLLLNGKKVKFDMYTDFKIFV